MIRMNHPEFSTTFSKYKFQRPPSDPPVEVVYSKLKTQNSKLKTLKPLPSDAPVEGLFF